MFGESGPLESRLPRLPTPTATTHSPSRLERLGRSLRRFGIRSRAPPRVIRGSTRRPRWHLPPPSILLGRCSPTASWPWSTRTPMRTRRPPRAVFRSRYSSTTMGTPDSPASTRFCSRISPATGTSWSAWGTRTNPPCSFYRTARCEHSIRTTLRDEVGSTRPTATAKRQSRTRSSERRIWRSEGRATASFSIPVRSIRRARGCGLRTRGTSWTHGGQAGAPLEDASSRYPEVDLRAYRSR